MKDINGTNVEPHFNGSNRYTIPIRRTSSVEVRLGLVEERDDGRWDWLRYRCPYYPEWNDGRLSQGVADNALEARAEVMKGLPQYADLRT